jgi:hypothetical protein
MNCDSGSEKSLYRGTNAAFVKWLNEECGETTPASGTTCLEEAKVSKKLRD